MLARHSTEIERQAQRPFAAKLTYPDEGLIAAARACERLFAPLDPEAGTLLGAFRALVEQTTLGRMQELYTATFDLDATCHPYVGYHLFGESYQRSLFLLGLKERYRAHGFECAGELPDHLAVMLRFLSVCPDADLMAELVGDALLPALGRMLGERDQEDAAERAPAQPALPNGHGTLPELRGSTGAESRPQSYGGVLQALRIVLERGALWATYGEDKGGAGDA